MSIAAVVEFLRYDEATHVRRGRIDQRPELFPPYRHRLGPDKFAEFRYSDMRKLGSNDRAWLRTDSPHKREFLARLEDEGWYRTMVRHMQAEWHNPRDDAYNNLVSFSHRRI